MVKILPFNIFAISKPPWGEKFVKIAISKPPISVKLSDNFVSFKSFNLPFQQVKNRLFDGFWAVKKPPLDILLFLNRHGAKYPLK